MLNKSRQTGLSLVELMVGLVVGLIVVAGASAMYVTTVRGQAYGLRAAKLNQDLRATMSVIASDMRRSGYWAGAIVAGSPPTFPPNPYSSVGGTQTVLTVPAGGTCVMYAYDADADASNPVEAGEVFGFRLNVDVVEMLEVDTVAGPTVTSNCAAGTWSGITSNDTVVIDALTFSTTGSQCMNATKGISWQVTADSVLAPCAETAVNVNMNGTGVHAAPDGGDLLTEVMQVTVSLTGHHSSDATMASTITETVHLANNRMFNQP
jgi:prepilin peptidase dependent protein B